MREKRPTQSQRILKFMQTHKKGITALQALNSCGCLDLAGRIRDLREDGHLIDGEFIYVTNRFNEKVRIKQYTLREK